MTTSTTSTNVIVTAGPCECHEVATFQAYHRNFPEVKAEGDTEVQALERLATQIKLALEHIPGGHGRKQMEDALHEVESLQTAQA